MPPGFAAAEGENLGQGGGSLARSGWLAAALMVTTSFISSSCGRGGLAQCGGGHGDVEAGDGCTRYSSSWQKRGKAPSKAVQRMPGVARVS